jgi:hypothetical protein
MNRRVPQAVIDDALADDPGAAAAEYLAEFRADCERPFTEEAVNAATDPQRFELPPVADRVYCAFVDPSGGSQDSMTLAIAHHADGRAVLDAVREVKPPFDPDGVTKDFADLLKAYRLATVTGDAYGGDWPRSRFLAHGITYELSELTKSELFQAFLPLVNGARVALLDLPRLRVQIVSLERRVGFQGRASISHPPGGHDDVANAAAGACVLAAEQPDLGVVASAGLRDDEEPRRSLRAAMRSEFGRIAPF